MKPGAIISLLVLAGCASSPSPTTADTSASGATTDPGEQNAAPSPGVSELRVAVDERSPLVQGCYAAYARSFGGAVGDEPSNPAAGRPSVLTTAPWEGAITFEVAVDQGESTSVQPVEILPIAELEGVSPGSLPEGVVRAEAPSDAFVSCLRDELGRATWPSDPSAIIRKQYIFRL